MTSSFLGVCHPFPELHAGCLGSSSKVLHRHRVDGQPHEEDGFDSLNLELGVRIAMRRVLRGFSVTA